MLMFAMICALFIDPILSVALIDLGMKESNTGLAFGLIGVALIFGSITAGFLAEKVKIVYIMAFGIFLMSFSYVLIGPTLFFGGLPDEIWIVMVGLFLQGFAGSCMYVPVTPEMIDINTQIEKEELTQKYRAEGKTGKELKDKVE